MEYFEAPLQQFWMGTEDTNTATKFPYLVRDNQSSVSSAPNGRNFRLGDTIDTGPYSTWNQDSWVGGMNQLKWRDPQMYEAAFGLRTTDPSGRIDLWPGLRNIYSVKDNNANRSRINCMLAGASVDGSPSTQNLYLGDDDGNLIKIDDNGGTATAVAAYGSEIRFLAHLDEDNTANSVGQMVAVGRANGTFSVYDSIANTNSNDPAPPGGEFRCGVGWNRAFYAIVGGNTSNQVKLYKRTYGAGPATWTKISDINTSNGAGKGNIVVWGGALWLATTTHGNDTVVYSSNGSTVAEAFRLQGVLVNKLVSHYGSLYLCGNKLIVPVDGGSDSYAYGVVYKYNGSSLTKLYDASEHPYPERTNSINDACSWGKYLVWTHDYADSVLLRAGDETAAVHPGVTVYDAENDAISPGPFLPWKDNNGTHTQDVYCTAVAPFDGGLALAFYDLNDFGAGNCRYTLAVGKTRPETHCEATGFSSLGTATGFGKGITDIDPSGVLYSSIYDATIYNEDKAWLQAVINYRLADDGEIKVYWRPATASEADWTVLTTISYDALDTDWQIARLPIVGAKSDRIQLKIQLTDSSGSGANVVAVRAMAIQFMLAPKARKQWRYKLVLADDQVDLAGDAMNDMETQYNQLLALWELGVPVYMWELQPNGDPWPGYPAMTEANRVQLTEFQSTWTRPADDEDQQVREVALTMVEVV